MSSPRIVRETPEWALIFKPHDMPSAPLQEHEPGTLLDWFLQQRPEASVVIGKKNIERGLLHRLDTGTEGIILIAKTQECYDLLFTAQKNGLIRKTYFAFCTPSEKTHTIFNKSIPFIIQSRFRSFGPGRKQVRPLFVGMRGFEDAKTDYETIIEKAEYLSPLKAFGIICSLSRGYRHQVRSHLSYLGFPIIGDVLYNPNTKEDEEVPLQLYAPGISFTDPFTGQLISFLLPLPDKMSR